MGHDDLCYGLAGIDSRNKKPREVGISIVNDRDLALRQVEDLIEVNGDIIDYVKFVDHAGMATRYSAKWIKEKLKIYESHNIPTFPGGLIFEISENNNKGEKFIERTKELGFKGVEISNDVIPALDSSKKTALIKKAKDLGLIVFTELGRYIPTELLTVEESVNYIKADLDRGVDKLAVEFSDIKQLIENDRFDVIIDIVEKTGKERLCFEAGPGGWPNIHAHLIRYLGNDVNLENIESYEISQLEAMRRGIHRSVEFSFFK